MKITIDEVKATAALARLALGEEEAGRLARDLDAILRYVDELLAVDVADVAPMTHAAALAAPGSSGRGDDMAAPPLTIGDVLASAPDRDGDLFRVPRVIAHDKDA